MTKLNSITLRNNTFPIEFKDFDQQFYFNSGYPGGPVIAEVGDVLYHPGDQIYYTIERNHETDDVMLHGNNGTVREPDKDFIHSCSNPPDSADIPELPS